MKVYIPGADLRTGVDVTQFPVSDTSHILRMYSSEGIFIVDDDTVFKVDLNDNRCIRRTVGGVDVLIDQSQMKKKKCITRLPSRHFLQDLSVTRLRLRENARICLVLERENDKIDTLYIETNEPLSNPTILEDFLTLVSGIRISNPVLNAPVVD